MFVNYDDVDPRVRGIVGDEDSFDSPRVVRVVKFDEDGAEKFAKDMSAAARTGQQVIPVIIDSYGGDVYSLFTMVDILKRAPVPVATVVEGKAMSCGAVLFTCGQEGMRYMGEHATLMIHDVSSSSEYKKTEEVKVDAKETERLNRVFVKMMAKNIGKPEKYIDNIMTSKNRADWYLDAKEALKHNLTNHIGIPTLKVKVTVSDELVLTVSK